MKLTPIKEVEFLYSENQMLIERTFSTTSEANEAMRVATADHPPDYGYDKTEFIVTFADNQFYRGRLNVTQGTTIGSHFRAMFNFYCGPNATMPKGASPAGWALAAIDLKHLQDTYDFST